MLISQRFLAADTVANAAPAIDLSDVLFRFSRQKDSFCLTLPALQIAAGARAALVGPSGAGKSTLLGLIAGVLLPERGQVDILAQSLTALSSKQRDRFRADNLGIIFQKFNLLPYLSVLDNVVLALEFSQFASLSSAEKKDRACYFLNALDIDVGKMAQQKAAQLSVGQQQRVAAARACVANPKLILADEPTSALDAERQEAFLELLFRQQEQTAATLLMVTHDHHLAGQFRQIIDLRHITQVGPRAAGRS